jgi:hypothetical protein
MKLLALLTLLFSAFSLTAQSTISGVVTDSATGAPLKDVHVFLNATTKAVRTNELGQYRLENIPAGEYEIVFALAGYLAEVDPVGSAQLPLQMNVKLEQKQEPAEKDHYKRAAWRDWMNVFVGNLVGKTANAIDCRVTNLGEITPKYDADTKVFKAECEDMVIIKNRALGYVIHYKIDQFVYYRNNSRVVSVGFYYFSELKDDETVRDEKYAEKRAKAYYGSPAHFLKSLFYDVLHEQGFILKRVVYDHHTQKDIVEPELLTADSVVISTENRHLKLLRFNEQLQVYYRHEQAPLSYVGYFGEEYGTWRQLTRLSLVNNAPAVYIDPNGNCFNNFDLLLDGYMGWEKLADRVPLDYEPKRTDHEKRRSD